MADDRDGARGIATLGRRGLLAGGCGCLGALALPRPAWAAPAGVPAAGPLAFQVSRNGSAIGTHRLDFTQDGATTTVRIDASFRVGFGFITLYRYHHQGVEIWRDGAFASLHTITHDNGTNFEVRADRVASGIRITATGIADRIAPPGTLPLTHWSVAAMAAPLFNPQTGKMLRETCQPQGPGTVTLADGRAIRATRYALAGEAPMQDWYDTAKIWAALDGTGTDGSRIRYRRV
jgi:hypothetical protein